MEEGELSTASERGSDDESEYYSDSESESTSNANEDEDEDGQDTVVEGSTTEDETDKDSITETSTEQQEDNKTETTLNPTEETSTQKDAASSLWALFKNFSKTGPEQGSHEDSDHRVSIFKIVSRFTNPLSIYKSFLVFQIQTF